MGNYTSRLGESLAEPAYVVPITDQVPCGNVVQVALPSKDTLQPFDAMMLDFALSCAGNMDRDCSVWDRIISLTADCGGGRHELGRWINAFQRKEGHWLTAAPFLPLLYPNGTSSTCNFTVTTGTGDHWLQTLNLRFTKSKPSSLGQPRAVVPIVYSNMGEGFNGPNYNLNRTIHFSSPLAETHRVAVGAIITGHSGCEFQPTSHHFVVNGHDYNTSSLEYRSRFMEAGSALGCAEKTILGAVPNEHGTWYYGRNGWCDGQDVKPLVWDITDSIPNIKEGVHSLRYYALSYANGDPNKPNENGCSGIILLSSYLLFW